MKKKNTQSDEEFYSDELFIVYANSSLIENVENFKYITDAIHEMDNRFFFEVMGYGREVDKPSEEEAKFLNGHEYSVGTTGLDLDFVINEIINISKMARPMAEIDRSERSNPYGAHNQIAFEAAFGWSEIDCKDCDRNIMYGENNPYLKKYGSIYYDQEIRCYACDQSRYIDMLDALIEEDDWFIEQFNSLMETRNQLTADVMLFYDKPTYHLKKYQWMNTTLYFQNYRPLTNCFHNFLSAYVGYSLGDFLSQSKRNWKRIKKCAVCGVYFVSEKADKRLIKCS